MKKSIQNICRYNNYIFSFRSGTLTQIQNSGIYFLKKKLFLSHQYINAFLYICQTIFTFTIKSIINFQKQVEVPLKTMYVAYFFILYVARGFFVKVFLMQYIGLDKNATRKDAISDGSGILPDTRLISGFERDREKKIMCSIHLFGLILNHLYLNIRFLSCRPIT